MFLKKIDWFRTLSSNLLRDEKSHKVSKVSILQPHIFKHKLNMCLNKIIIGQNRYLKSPVTKHSPCNLVIMLDLTSVSYNCLVARALSKRLIHFWVSPFTGCLRCNLNNSVTQSFLTPSPALLL